ncbi:MAG: hypothetical protein ACPGC9_02220, partial [Cytophagales bacterium]
ARSAASALKLGMARGVAMEYGKKLAQASGSNAYFMMIPGSGHIIRPSSSIGYNIRQHITDFLS